MNATPPSGPPSSRHDRLRACFDALAELPPAEREAGLCAFPLDEDERDRVRRWLAADAGHGFLETPLAQQADRIGEAGAGAGGASHIGQSIGGFRVVRELGRGGMATVFLGEREGDGFCQLAAVKLLRRGLFSDVEQRLFQRERRVLATLTHRGVARLIDGGVTDAGIPYLVMEYVDGVPITHFASAHQLGVAERLRLFADVCEAVAAAHQRLIVHRDIKPSNILVEGDGTARLLDFGIAKLLDDDTDAATATGLPVLTPGYAAPEQYVRGAPITTATDVYALGVLLHELLLGARPGDAARAPSTRIDEARVAAIHVPVTLRTLRAALAGDLDNIVLKALAAEPGLRYAGAREFADDIARHLRGEPVMAHPPSRWYRARKFVSRHRGSVLSSTLFIAAVFAALGIALWQAQRARAQARRAVEIQAFVEALFEPFEKGSAVDRTPTLAELLQRGRERVDQRQPQDPGVRADLLAMFARIADTLGETGGNRALAEDAARANLQAYGERDQRTIGARELYARVLRKLGDYAAARAELGALRASLRPGDMAAQDHARLLDALGALGRENGMAPLDLIALEREALDLREGDADASIDDLATGYNNLGNAYLYGGDRAQAIAWLEKAYATYVADKGDSVAAASVLLNLGVANADAGRWPDARQRYGEARAMFARIPIERHPALATVLVRECGLLVDMEILDEADRVCAEGDAMMLALHGRAHRQYTGVLTRRARLQLAHGQVAAAAADFEAAREIARALESASDREFVLATIDASQSRSWWLQQDFTALRDAMLRLLSSTHPRLGPRTIGAFHFATLAALACGRAPAPSCGDDRVAAAMQALMQPELRDHALYLPSLLALAQTEAPGIDAPMIEQALAAAATGYGPRHSIRVQAHRALARLHRDAGDARAADAEDARAATLAGGLPVGHPLRAATG